VGKRISVQALLRLAKEMFERNKFLDFNRVHQERILELPSVQALDTKTHEKLMKQLKEALISVICSRKIENFKRNSSKLRTVVRSLPPPEM
jgi:hypothetical protein